MEFLTPAEKAERLGAWEAIRLDLEMDGDTAGRGYPDPEIFALADRLNAILGVCTVQSCSGHPRIQGSRWRLWEKRRRWSAPGNLWLRLDENMFGRFVRAAAHDLSTHSSIVEVCVRWGRERDGPIVDITFVGLDKSREALKKSGDLLVGVFTRLAMGTEV